MANGNSARQAAGQRVEETAEPNLLGRPPGVAKVTTGDALLTVLQLRSPGLVVLVEAT